MLARLDNQVVFKEAFTNKIVFEQLVKDFLEIDIKVGNIETEKQFHPKGTSIDIKIDIFAETLDNRVIIEIQKIDYDHNFDRFLHYFISILIEQQKKYAQYKFKKTVYGIVILTTPYQIDQITGEAIQDNLMEIDFNPRNLKGEIIKLWNHKLIFLNPNKKYPTETLPSAIKDWIDLFRSSIKESETYTLNLNNKGIAKAVDIIKYDNISPEKLHEIKVASGRRKVIEQAVNKAEKKLTKQIQAEKQKTKEANKKVEAANKKAEAEKQKAEAEKQKAEAEKQKAEAEKQKAEANFILIVKNLRQQDFSNEQIASITGKKIEDILKL